MDYYLYLLLPLFAFVLSFFTSQGGVSGAFLILPFQISVLGFSTPAASSTNLLYNIVSIPSGVYGYMKEKRFILPLTLAIIAGTLPGAFLGVFLRVSYLPDPKAFKLFAGLVLLFLGVRLLTSRAEQERSKEDFEVRVREVGIRVSYDFLGKSFTFSVPLVSSVSFLVGIVSGTYGVGGGVFIASFLISVLGLPTYTIAGSILFATFLTSLFGIGYYSLFGYPPEFLIGILLGIGGIFGMYAGSRFQRFMPERAIRLILSILVLLISARYIHQYFL
jgi:hypothetical protein